ncbi:MAG: putative uridine kinase, partial [Candidatus Saccharibacteria bacterium]|nr:putative uridine kinase [Candidatus Saccharibacteria bacterium]
MKKEIIDKIVQGVKAKNSPADFPVQIIAIDGHGGAGKSTLAENLSRELGAEIIHTDDFATWDNFRW